MKEEYLHQVWLTKRLPMHQLVLTDGRKLNIIQTGWHNHESGPDFFNGSIELDGIRWNGNIEIHIRSSDWYAHKHHLDQAYNNVILHVVYQHDKPVLINGEAIPTLELKSILDQKHWASYESLIKNDAWIACGSQLDEVDPFFISAQIESALIARLDRKAQDLALRFEVLGRNLQQLQYEVLAQSFGTKVNALPFTELAQRMPVKTIWREGKDAAPALLLGTAGFLEELDPLTAWEPLKQEWGLQLVKHSFQPMKRHSWKFKGLRPQGFPDLRIIQFAAVISRMQQDFSLLEKSVEELLHFFNEKDSSDHAKLSAAFQNLILLNSVVPLLWWYGNHTGEEAYRRKALDLLESIEPESNAVIKSWKSIGVSCNSAYDSQGLLELKNEMCDQKKCLYCKIGLKILGK